MFTCSRQGSKPFPGCELNSKDVHCNSPFTKCKGIVVMLSPCVRLANAVTLLLLTPKAQAAAHASTLS